LLLKEKRSGKSKRKGEAQEENGMAQDLNMLRYYEDVAGYNGVSIF